MKSGIDFFPLDVSLDSKMQLIEAEFGLTGFGVIVHLLQKIYGGEGYYIEWTDDVALLFAQQDCRVGYNVVSEIISASIKRGMFSKSVYDKYHVLTSRGIQKRYFEAVKRRKELTLWKDILLVDANQILKNVYIEWKNVDISSENADGGEQSKVKKSRVKKSTVEDSCAAAQMEAPKPEDLFTGVLLDYVNRWLAYKKEKRQSYQATGLNTLFNQIKRYASAYGDLAVAEVISQSISSNYMGITWDKLGRSSSSRNRIVTEADKKYRDSILAADLDDLDKIEEIQKINLEKLQAAVDKI